MGIYDRDYYQEPGQGGAFAAASGGRMMVTNLVIINAVVYLFEIIFDKGSGYQFTTDYLCLNSTGLFVTNWKLWQFVTYGFVHSWENIFHIIGNMFCLWFFGRDVEGIYGKQRFLKFYLSTIVLSGLLGIYAQRWLTGGDVVLLGASGGVAGVIMLYIWHFPRRTLLLYFVIPVRAWVLGVIFLVYDLMGTADSINPANPGEAATAHAAHLVGMACGLIYFKTGWDLSRILPGTGVLKRFKRRPSVRIHDPNGDDLNDEVDRLLAKIGREGESSLTRKERRTLERASQRYKQKQR